MLNGSDPVVVDQAKLSVLQMVRIQHRVAEAAVANRVEAIQMARDFGASWTEVGAAMGMSRQAAHKRFGIFMRGPAPHRHPH